MFLPTRDGARGGRGIWLLFSSAPVPEAFNPRALKAVTAIVESKVEHSHSLDHAFDSCEQPSNVGKLKRIKLRDVACKITSVIRHRQPIDWRTVHEMKGWLGCALCRLRCGNFVIFHFVLSGRSEMPPQVK